MNAYNDLIEYLEENEVLEHIVFGSWGWGGYNEPGCDDVDDECNELPPNPPVPLGQRGVVHEFSPEVISWMNGWSFYGGYGAPDCYAVRVWTNQRVIWVTQYDGATGLDSAPRNPSNFMPDMPGG